MWTAVHILCCTYFIHLDYFGKVFSGNDMILNSYILYIRAVNFLRCSYAVDRII
jgi:hypothetical protein